MARQRPDPEQAKLQKQQRNQRYRVNLAATERNREKNTLYQREKREQARLSQQQDRLNQLADVVTQQQYLDVEIMMNEALITGSVEEGETVEVNSMAKEDDEVSENFGSGHWDGGFTDEVDLDMNNNGYGQLNGGFEQEHGSTLEGGFADNDWNVDAEESGIIIY
jgi:hypothetical protein